MSLMQQEIREQPELIRRLASDQNETLSAVVKELRRRRIRSVVIAARGSSDHAGIFGQYLLTTYCGVVCALAVPSAITHYGAKPDYSRSLVIGLSQSGQAADVIAVLESANASGALTLAITNDPASPLAKAAAFHLDCAAGEEKSVAATKTFMAEMYWMARLTAAWSRNAALRRELNALGGVLKKNLPLLSDTAEKIAPRYRFMADGFVLARGYCYPVALESALKLKETNYIRMQGAASSDFYHGPMAQVDQNTPVIAYAMNGPVLDDTVKILDRLTEIGAALLVITDSTEIAARYAETVRVINPATEISAAFSGLLFVQLLAANLAKVRGLNPDAPRNLKKVTVTQ